MSTADRPNNKLIEKKGIEARNSFLSDALWDYVLKWRVFFTTEYFLQRSAHHTDFWLSVYRVVVHSLNALQRFTLSRPVVDTEGGWSQPGLVKILVVLLRPHISLLPYCAPLARFANFSFCPIPYLGACSQAIPTLETGPPFLSSLPCHVKV